MKRLYSGEEKDSCGFGLIAQCNNIPSHYVVKTAISSLCRLEHRGAIAADGLSGDGCGILMKIPDSFFRQTCQELNIRLSSNFAVAMLFCHRNSLGTEKFKAIIESQLQKQGLDMAGYRQVPVDESVLGEQAKSNRPDIIQLFVNAPDDLAEEEFERKLYLVRQLASQEVNDKRYYICSFSSRVIIYKGLVMPVNLAVFYKDLGNPDMQTSLAIFHQRFSTNTAPQWWLAQPFRMLAHNGEINTISGNRKWAKTRLNTLVGERLPELKGIEGLVNQNGSDSSSLDNMLEVLVQSGMSLMRAIRVLIPPAWQNAEHVDVDLRAFFEYHAMHAEPWDGPAGIVLTDGRFAGCTLDRNGLRPARYIRTADGHLIIASESGTASVEESQIIEKGRLRAGELMLLDLETGEFLHPKDIDQRLSSRKPYRQWLSKHTNRLKSIYQRDYPSSDPLGAEALSRFEKLFLLTMEEREQIISVMAGLGQEAIGSMGDDTPLAILSQKNRSLYDYFRQLFAQVTNPPIDSLRESVVMSLQTYIGNELSTFRENEIQARRLIIESPVLSEGEFKSLLQKGEDYPSHIIDLNFPKTEGLKAALDRIVNEAHEAVMSGAKLLVVSDRAITQDALPMPALMAVGAIHQHLIHQQMRSRANIVVETATARDAHHFACLLAYGATMVYPYLAYESILQMITQDEISGIDAVKALHHYRKAIDKGLLKIMSKMGISTLKSYRGAQLFEIIGLSDDVVSQCFDGSASRINGMGYELIEAELLSLSKNAWNMRLSREPGGLLKFMNGGEYHAYNPDVVQSLQKAVNTGLMTDYQKYRGLVNNRPITNMRDLLSFKAVDKKLQIADVEPVEKITPRFDSAAMSLGALSPEAHETLAQAMNYLGGRSNSGEGGEDFVRYHSDKMSKIKQIASGRFGVTAHYLVNAEVLQIKMAQGAKPGEGGQLPGDKVNETIARLRFSRPGIALISPPPHHDIYSIEDLAQLIFDLKQVNPDALISVKLVAAPGVGTVAAGVAKAYADMITISGYDGGTGASPLSSIHYAGSPWELGLSEAHQALVDNDLRDKVILQTDGGLKTGLDVIKAAMLGAESFGFGTAPMIAMGCKFLRICHLNNCATGIATQNAILRQHHFKGNAEKVIRFFQFIAADVREHLAQLGFESLEQIIGRNDLLEKISTDSEKFNSIDLSAMLSPSKAFNPIKQRNHGHDQGTLNQRILKDAKNAVDEKRPIDLSYAINNSDRSVGASLSGYIAKKYAHEGLDDNLISIHLKGSAGQSFAAWLSPGIELNLVGEANDYVAKGMSGGHIVIKPATDAAFETHTAPIIGNTCLYGATGGRLYAAGEAGERFAVRNSGAIAVVEGVGDHGCEYMTDGVVVVLGSTGINFGAGMTGGFAFVLDLEQQFIDRYNNELIDIHRISTEQTEREREYLFQLIEDYHQHTQSAFAAQVLADFSRYASRFWLIKPKADSLGSLIDTLGRAA